jgi:hypothetical protein
VQSRGRQERPRWTLGDQLRALDRTAANSATAAKRTERRRCGLRSAENLPLHHLRAGAAAACRGGDRSDDEQRD